MLRDEIENKIQIRKMIKRKTTIKIIKTKFDIKNKWNQMMRDEFEVKNQSKMNKKNKTNYNKKNDDQIGYKKQMK